MYIDVNTIVITIISTVITALVAWAFSQLTSYLKAKAERERAKKKLDELERYSSIAGQTVVQLVDYLNNTVVNELKMASEDGTLTEEEAESIKQTCKYKLYSTLTEESLDSLKNVYGDIDGIFDMWIVNAVNNAKRTGGSGIDANTAIGMAKAQSITQAKKDEIKSKLTARLEGIMDTTT